MLAVAVPQAAKRWLPEWASSVSSMGPYVSFYAWIFYRRRYRGIGHARAVRRRPQDSEAWHDIKWFRKFVGRSLGYVTVPKAMVSKFKLFKLAHSDFALVVVMLVLVATVAIPVMLPMAMMVPVVMLMMPTIMIPMSMPALDTMHYAAGDALAWIPLCQGRCASRQHDSGGGGK
jgi:hypothetical protein